MPHESACPVNENGHILMCGNHQGVAGKNLPTAHCCKIPIALTDLHHHPPAKKLDLSPTLTSTGSRAHKVPLLVSLAL